MIPTTRRELRAEPRTSVQFSAHAQKARKASMLFSFIFCLKNTSGSDTRKKTIFA